MSWIRLDDQIAHHPKFAKAGPLASWLWVCCIGYSQKYLTDGFIPSGALSSISSVRDSTRQTRRLVEAGLLDIEPGGFRVHDYLEHNASAREVKAEREWDRFRKELYANSELVSAIRQRDSNRCRYCGERVNFTDRRSKNGGQFDHVIPRGPNTLDNIVVACRGCNIKKGNRLASQCGMELLPEPTQTDLVQNQVRTSSELILRARARSPIPSHPIHIKKEQKIRAVAAPPSANGNGQTMKSPNIRLLTKFAHEAFEQDDVQSYADLAEAVKLLCAARHVEYDSTMVGKAIESAAAQRKLR